MSNAHKYTPAGGELSLRAGGSGDQVWLEVQDTGIGMSAEEQAQLFARFYRARNRTTEEVGGTGLGLAISKSLAELQGGSIEVSSAPGQGSTFRVVLPTLPAQPALPPDRDSLLRRVGGLPRHV